MQMRKQLKLVVRLMGAKRPRAAFHCAHYDIAKFDPELLYRLMEAIVKESEEPEGHFRLQQHYIEEAFERINTSTVLTLDQKAGLEYLYIDALAKPRVHGGKYGIPNLERYVDAHPSSTCSRSCIPTGERTMVSTRQSSPSPMTRVPISPSRDTSYSMASRPYLGVTQTGTSRPRS